MGQGLLVGNLECIKRRNAAKGRRKYAARKVREQARNTAPVLSVIEGKARPQLPKKAPDGRAVPPALWHVLPVLPHNRLRFPLRLTLLPLFLRLTHRTG